jgi:hypothetical protein
MNIENQNLDHFSNQELVQHHARVHQAFADAITYSEPYQKYIQLHSEILEQYEKRLMEHPERYLLDYLSLRQKTADGYQEKITLSSLLEVLPDEIPACIGISLVGSLVVQGQGNDIDTKIHASNPESDLARILTFKFSRALPKAFRKRISWNFENTIFTNYLPLYDVILRKRKNQDIIPMQRVTDPEIKKMAEKAILNNKITLGEYFYLMKPTKAFHPDEPQTLEVFLKYVDFEEFKKWHITKKYDGVHMSIHHQKNGKVIIWSEDGKRLEDSIPKSVIEEIQRVFKNHDIICLAEFEVWKGNQHLPREAAAGYLHEEEKERDWFPVLNCYDLVYFNRDIHEIPHVERRKKLDSLAFEESTVDAPSGQYHMIHAPERIAENYDQLKAIIQDWRAREGSEGVILKGDQSIYFLDVESQEQWWKFHNSGRITAAVIERVPTKVPTVFNYRYGLLIDDAFQEKVPVVSAGKWRVCEFGKTFSTAEKLNSGDLFWVEFETLNMVHNIPEDKLEFSCWSPRFLGRSERARPHTISEAISIAEEEFCFQEKIIQDERIIYLSSY